MFNSFNFEIVSCEVCGLALSWSKCIPSLFTKFPFFFCSFLNIISISLQYDFAVIDSSGLRKDLSIMPLAYHQTVTITFFDVVQALVHVWGFHFYSTTAQISYDCCR